MTISVAQSGKKIENSSSTITTGNVTTAASGSGFFVFVCWYGSATFTSLADNKGNSYAQIGSEIAMSGDSTFKGRLYYVQNGFGGSNHNWTATLSAGAITTLLWCEVTGGVTSGLVDQSPAGLQDTSSPFVTNTTGTTSQASELLLAFFGTYSAGSETITWGNSFTQVVAEGNGAANCTAGVGQRLVSSTGIYTGSITSNQASETFGFILTLKDAGGGPTNYPVTYSSSLTMTSSRTREAGAPRAAGLASAVSRTQGLARTLASGLTQGLSYIRAQAVIASATLTETPSRMRAVDASRAAGLAESPAAVRSATIGAKSATLTETPARVRSVSKLPLSVGLTEAPSRVRQIGLPKSAGLAQQVPSAAVTAIDDNMTTIVTTMSPTRVRAMARLRSVVQASTLVIGRSWLRTYSRTLSQAASMTRQGLFTRAAAATLAAGVIKALARLLTSGLVMSPLETHGSNVISLATALTQTAAMLRACARNLSSAQSANPTVRKDLPRTSAAMLTQVAGLIKGQGYFRAANALLSVVPAMFRGVGLASRPAASAVQVPDEVRRALGSTRVVSVVQEPQATRQASISMAFSAVLAQTGAAVKSFSQLLRGTLVGTGSAIYSSLNLFVGRVRGRFLPRRSPRSRVL